MLKKIISKRYWGTVAYLICLAGLSQCSRSVEQDIDEPFASFRSKFITKQTGLYSISIDSFENFSHYRDHFKKDTSKFRELPLRDTVFLHDQTLGRHKQSTYCALYRFKSTEKYELLMYCRIDDFPEEKIGTGKWVFLVTYDKKNQKPIDSCPFGILVYNSIEQVGSLNERMELVIDRNELIYESGQFAGSISLHCNIKINESGHFVKEWCEETRR